MKEIILKHLNFKFLFFSSLTILKQLRMNRNSLVMLRSSQLLMEKELLISGSLRSSHKIFYNFSKLFLLNFTNEDHQLLSFLKRSLLSSNLRNEALLTTSPSNRFANARTTGLVNSRSKFSHLSILKDILSALKTKTRFFDYFKYFIFT